MIADDRDLTDPSGHGRSAGLPEAATARELPLSGDDRLLLLTVPLASVAAGADGDVDPTADLVGHLRHWVAGAAAVEGPPPVVVPLYGCLVAWSVGRAAVAGPPERLDQLETATVEFATREAALRDAERRSQALLDAIEADAATAFEIDERSPDRRSDLTRRYRDAVAIARRLALLAPTIHAHAVHPPTLASQLGERLRERARLAERHEQAVARAELAERVTEACGQRAADAAIARRQTGLEWAIVVLLVVQTALLVVELLSRQGGS